MEQMLHAIGTLLSGIAAVAGLVSAVVVLRIKLEVQRLRTDIAEARRADEKQMQQWVEERFLRVHQQA